MLKPVTGFETDWVASTRWFLPMDDNPRREIIQVGPQDRPGGQLLLPGPIENLECSEAVKPIQPFATRPSGPEKCLAGTQAKIRGYWR